MKAAFLGLRTCIYRVNDLTSAKEWYSRAFNVNPYFDEPFYVGFSIGGFELGLQPEESNDLPKGENVICYWGTDEIDNCFKNLISQGATIHENPKNVGGNIVVASVKDPWSNIIGLIYNPDFKQD